MIKNNKISKFEIAKYLRDELEISLRQTNIIISAIINNLKDTIFFSNEIKIKKFGKFFLKHKKQRKVKSFFKQKEYIINPRKVVTFKQSGIMKKRLNTIINKKECNYSNFLSKILSKDLNKLNLNNNNNFTNKAVNSFFKFICDSLIDGKKIEIRNFGVFKVNSYPSYQGRNPKTGESIFVPSKRQICFKYSKNIFNNIPIN